MTSFAFLGGYSGFEMGAVTPPSGTTGEGAVPAGTERLYANHDLWGEIPSNRSGGRIAWYCPAHLHDAMIESIYGVVTAYPSIWGGSVPRRLPMRHPDYPGLYATRFRSQGMGKTIPGRLYSWYQVEVDFETLPYGTGTDTPFMSVRRDFGSRHITRKGRYLHMSDGYRLTQNQAMPIPTIVYVVTIYGVSAVNAAAVSAATAAPINSATLYLPGLTINPGYAIFRGLSDQIDLSSAGQVTKTVSLKFEFQDDLQWGQTYHEVTGAKDFILNPDGTRMIKSSDLNLLFL